MNVDDLANAVVPSRTTLLFGAGASIPSGGPSGSQLARTIAKLLSPEPEGDDLAEIGQIVENRKGRAALVAAVRKTLEGIAPTAGLLALPDFDWLSIYTTNFDTLVEQAYQAKARGLEVYRSNFDVTHPRDGRTPLYKIHGCVTQDVADGHKSRMLITESDYDDFEQYRQTLFNSLVQDMFTSDTVIVGQSLSDRHLKDLAKRVVGLRPQGVATRVFLMVHDYSADRAELYTRLGIEVVHGALDDLLRALMRAGKTAQSVAYSTSTDAGILTSELVLSTIDVHHAAGLTPNVARLFNGAPATYADVRGGFTISRVAQYRLEEAFKGARGFFIVLEGARGVGKTSLARALMLALSDRGLACWEHQSDQAFSVDSWLGVESRLRLSGSEGVLLVDDCSRHLAQVNRLVDKLSALDRPHLRVVVTADAAKWKVSVKSQGFFSRGTLLRLSVLERGDLDEMVGLVDRRPEIKALVEQSFLALGRAERVSRLRDKCSAEMFVCLKNIFANDSLDDILLQEYFSLAPEPQDVYRYVAAVQALGGHVHRQLIMRVLGISATGLDSLLGQLEGIVFEQVIDTRQGIYGWQTRHDVIASIIAKLKFADQAELEQLLLNLIDGLNPSVRLELETAIAIATEEGGIQRITNFDTQVSLYRRLINTIPAHKTPRRRLVRLYLDKDLLPEATQEILSSERAVGQDPVLMRYKGQVGLRKAEGMKQVEESDRKAMLLDAENIIRRCIDKYGRDLYSYVTLGQIGLALARRFGDFRAADDAIEYLIEYEVVNGDPQIQQRRRELQDSLRRFETPWDGVSAIELEDAAGTLDASLIAE
ncbi:SIR2 family protein [Frigoribacterium sp. UYMn621]|uniref:SIR2 family protein n=1 Tax=Frigoribacterium sp. UYMn621 TaxID=3156343 RepID=UPI00339748A0